MSDFELGIITGLSWLVGITTGWNFKCILDDMKANKSASNAKGEK